MGRFRLQPEDGVQLMLDPAAPQPGDCYQNKHNSMLCTIVGLEQRRYCWVRLRFSGLERSMRLDEFLEHFSRV